MYKKNESKILARKERNMEKIVEETTQKWYDDYYQFIVNHRKNLTIPILCYLQRNPIYTCPYSKAMQQSKDIEHINGYICNMYMYQRPILWKRLNIPDPKDIDYWEKLSIYKDLTWTTVEQHIDKPWNWAALSYHSCVTWDIIQQYPEKPWDWNWISINPNIGFEIVQQHPEKHWDWAMICCNTMSIARENTIQQNIYKRLREWFAKSDLKRELMEHLWNPRNIHKWSGWGFDILEEE
jgi:hypothetical protein